LQQLSDILSDPEASANDRFVALDLLKNAGIAAGGVLPMCQDTGTAIVKGKKGQFVMTGGGDEEAIARTSNVGKAILTILNRGTVRVGDQKADERLLDQMLSGDRDALILGIFKATFGSETEVSAYCTGCSEFKTIGLDIDTDIKTKVLTDPINDRVFTVQGKTRVFTVQLPTGFAQKEMINNSDKTSAEINTIMLEHAVINIDGSPVLSKLQVQNLGVTDRRKIIDEINARVSGPQFDEITVTCPDCESEVSVPINFGTLFRF
jgi:hypothetical protein